MAVVCRLRGVRGVGVVTAGSGTRRFLGFVRRTSPLERWRAEHNTVRGVDMDAENWLCGDETAAEECGTVYSGAVRKR